jgi:hypothetical protein
MTVEVPGPVLSPSIDSSSLIQLLPAVYWRWPDVVLVYMVFMQSRSAAQRQAESGEEQTVDR